MTEISKFISKCKCIHLNSTFCRERERERGQWVVYYTSSYKFYDNVFLIVDLTTLLTLVNFDGFQPLILIYRRGNFLYYIFWDVHQFIGQCLIPLDPWYFWVITWIRTYFFQFLLIDILIKILIMNMYVLNFTKENLVI